jgi:hypothetical protein
MDPSSCVWLGLIGYLITHRSHTTSQSFLFRRPDSTLLHRALSATTSPSVSSSCSLTCFLVLGSRSHVIYDPGTSYYTHQTKKNVLHLVLQVNVPNSYLVGCKRLCMTTLLHYSQRSNNIPKRGPLRNEYCSSLTFKGEYNVSTLTAVRARAPSPAPLSPNYRIDTI